MFKRFRRSSKISATSSSSAQSTRQSSIATTCSIGSIITSKKPPTNFFSLPAELRNHIYNLAAQGAVLRLRDRKHDSKKRSSKSNRDPIPSLFLTSKQCRSEYLPLLLSTAKLQIQIIDFNFTHIISLIGSLYSSELKSLRLNPNLILSISFTPRASEKFGSMESNLRRWAKHRSSGLDRLPWRYRLGARQDSSVFVVSYQRCMTILKMVGSRLEKEQEALGWEVRRIMEGVEVPASSEGIGERSGREWESAVA